MKYKMIAADFDDTILRSDFTCSENFLSAVKEYENAGGKFVIATGRMTNVTRDICLELGLKGELITYQGAMITDIESGKIIDITPIPTEEAAAVGRYLEERGIFYQLYDNEKVIASGKSEYSETYAALSRAPLIDAGEPLSAYLIKNNISPVKLLIMANPEFVDGYIKELNAIFSENLLINTSKKWIVEIVSRKANKGIAVGKVAERAGIKPEEVICIGDSLNDVPMFEYAGLAAAVGNGSEAAKAAADIIAPSNDEDGVASVIREYGFIK